MPEAWLVSLICEEFGCTPSQALREIYEAPWPLVMDVMDLRAYQRAKEYVDNCKKLDQLQMSPMVTRVLENQWALMRERFPSKD